MPTYFEINREKLSAIGDKIRKTRMLKSISQSQLAFEVNTTLRQIQRIELGEINAGILYYIQIAEVLETPLKDLLDF